MIVIIQNNPLKIFLDNLQIQGFELEFKFEDKSTCIQIIPDNEKFIQGLPVKLLNNNLIIIFF